jgi:hypothetical protein
MGYTRYWNINRKLTQNREDTKFEIEMLDKIRKAINIAEQQFGIKICNGQGIGSPIITETEIWLNGDLDEDLDYETFSIRTTGNNGKYDFCKTARKPYDVVVNAILKILKDYKWVYNVDSDGFNEEEIATFIYRCAR